MPPVLTYGKRPSAQQFYGLPRSFPYRAACIKVQSVLQSKDPDDSPLELPDLIEDDTMTEWFLSKMPVLVPDYNTAIIQAQPLIRVPSVSHNASL